jgi:hypothetical protein
VKVRFAMKNPAGNLLFLGLRLSFRNWPCLLWAYVINLSFALLAGISLSRGFAKALEYSVASHGIFGDFNITSVGALLLRAVRMRGLEPQEIGLVGMSFIQFATLLFLIAGTVHIYFTGERSKISILLVRGEQYFWRFVRTSLLAGLVVVPLFLGVLVLRFSLLRRAVETAPSRAAILSIVSAVAVLFAASPLRLWLDLIEIYVVRNGKLGNRRILAAVRPALRLLSLHWLPMLSAFLLAGFIGTGFLTGCVYLWKDAVRKDQIWLACLISQIGLFLLLATRFWQRGMEVSLVLAVEPAAAALALPAPRESPPQSPPQTPSGSERQAPPVHAEPTLQELIQKLRNEPWGRPDARRTAMDGLLPPSPPQSASASARSSSERSASERPSGSSSTLTSDSGSSSASAPSADPGNQSASPGVDRAVSSPRLPPVRPAQDLLLAEHRQKMPLLDPSAEESDAQNSHAQPPRAPGGENGPT